MHNRWNLEGKKALVTGGSRGIGLAVAQELAGLGAEVLIVARNEKHLKTVISSHENKGISGIQCDISSGDDRVRLIEEIVGKWGLLDILVNNAGMNIRKPTTGYSEEEYDSIMETNLKAGWDLCRLCYPMLLKSGGGSIVNVSSVAGQTSVRTGVVYGMSKAAMDHMTRYLAAEWAADGIRVNGVAPWYIRTPLAETVLSDNAYKEEVISRTPMRNIGEPADAAAAVAFLCMPAAGWITGQVLCVDGGFTIYGF